MTEFVRGLWSLAWNHHGEGYEGDYDESDPDDKPLLRADLYYKGIRCAEGSYCTLAPEDTPESLLLRFSNDLFDKLSDDAVLSVDEEAEEVRFRDRIMQEWTWRTDPEKIGRSA